MELTVGVLSMPEEEKGQKETELVAASKSETYIEIPDVDFVIKETNFSSATKVELETVDNCSLLDEECAPEISCSETKIDIGELENITNEASHTSASEITLDLDTVDDNTIVSNDKIEIEESIKVDPSNDENDTSPKPMTKHESLPSLLVKEEDKSEIESETLDANDTSLMQEVLDDLYIKLYEIHIANDTENDRKRCFNELPFADCIDQSTVPTSSPKCINIIKEEIHLRYIYGDERPSSSSTNHDLHDSGITSSSSRTSNEQLSTHNIDLHDDDDDDDDDEFGDVDDEDTILQVVAQAEGFGIGMEEIIGLNDSDERLDELMTCLVCFDSCTGKSILHCYECDLYVCINCMRRHIKTKICEGVIRLYCVGSSCSYLLSDQMVTAFCPKSMPIYIKNRVEVENNPFKKTCPNCHKVEVISNLNDISQRKIKCSLCKFLWCHSCHSPWHSGLSCQQYQKDIVGKGKKALKFWADGKGRYHKNARKCPYCHFYIERISGCDHMKCIRCDTDFCYKCGGKHRSLGLLGNHYSTYSFLGCKYNLFPKKPVLRTLIRSTAFCGVVLGAPLAALLVVTGALCIIAVSPILLPIVLYRRCNYRDPDEMIR